MKITRAHRVIALLLALPWILLIGSCVGMAVR